VSHCHFLYHKIHTEYTKVETASFRVYAGELQPEIWCTPYKDKQVLSPTTYTPMETASRTN